MSYFDDQFEAWFEGGREWYCLQNKLDPEEYNYEVEGMPGDFDPYVFWAETEDSMDPNQANDMEDGAGEMIDMSDE